MKISDLRYVVEVSKWKSINKASKALFINQQQLSRIIGYVEKEIGDKIFIRNAKGVFPTEKGEEILSRFTEIIAIYDGLTLQNAPKAKDIEGKLNILTDINIWTSYAKLYRDFIKEYPKLKLTIKTIPGQGIIENLLKDGDGIGLFTQIIGENVSNNIVPEELIFQPVVEDFLMVYGAAENPYIKKYRTISLATLCKLPMITFKPYLGYISRTEKIFEHIGTPNIKYEVSDIKVFLELAKTSDCLFVSFHKPQYAIDDDFIGIPLRNKIICRTGILRHRDYPSQIYDIFHQYFCDYYNKLY